MSNIRNWLYRFLVFVGGGLLLLSWLMPWWSMFSRYLDKNIVIIRPWGLENDLGTQAWAIQGSAMPEWFAPVMWVYLGLCIVGLLYAIIFKDRKIRLIRKQFNLNRFVVGFVGLSYIFIVVLAVIVAAVRTGDFFGGLHLIGYSTVDLALVGAYDNYDTVEGALLPGYWLACAVGPLLVLLALFRNKIIGKPA